MAGVEMHVIHIHLGTGEVGCDQTGEGFESQTRKWGALAEV